MGFRHPIVLIALIGSLSAARAAAFGIADVTAARNTGVAQLKPATIAFSDKPADAVDGNLNMIRFDYWAHVHPDEKKFLALYPSYTEPTVRKAEHDGRPQVEKLYMYVAQARFLLDRAPGTIDPAHYVTLDFLGRIDPAIKHRSLAAPDVVPFTDPAGIGNQNPDRKWCTGRANSICVQSTYKLEGKIPLGILLVNKLRESAKKISDEIDFQSELSALSPAEVDQPGLQQLTALDTPVTGVLEQDIFYINQIMKFGKFLAVFQGHPADPSRTVVTAFMALAIKADVLDEKRGYEKVQIGRAHV